MAISTTGYVHHLANLHRITPATLLRHVIAPLVGHPNTTGLEDGDWGRYFARYVAQSPASLNGVGIVGQTFADGLGAATLRDDVGRLPLHNWRHVLPVQRMLVRDRRYCPIHLNTWRKTRVGDLRAPALAVLVP